MSGGRLNQHVERLQYGARHRQHAACVLDLARDVGERVEARVEPEDEGEQQRRVARAGAPAERREVELRRACSG